MACAAPSYADRETDHATATAPRDSDARAVMCRSLITQRNMIGKTLGFQLCPAPIWDMLLDLYIARQEGRTTYLWPLCVAANIPVSTAHRKVQEMTASGLVERALDDSDHRRVDVWLSTHCVEMLDRLMDQLLSAEHQTGIRRTPATEDE